MGILVPGKVATCSVDTVVRLARQLELCDLSSLDQLREEFLDFTLLLIFLPKLNTQLLIKVGNHASANIGGKLARL